MEGGWGDKVELGAEEAFIPFLLPSRLPFLFLSHLPLNLLFPLVTCWPLYSKETEALRHPPELIPRDGSWGK